MDLACPYCEHEIEAPDDYNETFTRYDYKCENCNKTFTFSVEYERNYESRKAPCLNGGEHDYSKANFVTNKIKCKYCDEVGYTNE